MAGVWLGEIPFYCCLPVGLTLPGSFNHVPTFIFFPVRTTKSTSVSIDSESTTSQCYSQSPQYLIAGGLWVEGSTWTRSGEWLAVTTGGWAGERLHLARLQGHLPLKIRGYFSKKGLIKRESLLAGKSFLKTVTTAALLSK